MTENIYIPASICDSSLRAVNTKSEKLFPYLGTDVLICTKQPTDVRIRFCPPEEYAVFNGIIEKEKGLTISTPIIQIIDFEHFHSNNLKEMKIRHNVYDWEKYKECSLRCYNNMHNEKTYIVLEAVMCKDYITVRGNQRGLQQGGGTSSPDLTKQNDSQGSRDNYNRGISGACYIENNGQPVLNTFSVFHVANSEDICDVQFYFTRKIHDNSCPDPHKISGKLICKVIYFCMFMAT